MDLPPAPVLLIALIALANVVVLLAVFARHRAAPRRLADIGGFMSSSYAADGNAADGEAVPGGWLPPASEGWPASRHVWADTGTWPTEPIVVEPAPPEPSPAEASLSGPVEPEPFEYPEPTSLEQRGAAPEVVDDVDDVDDVDAIDDDEWDDDIDDDADDEHDVHGAMDQGDTEATPEMTNETDEPQTVSEPAPPTTLHAVARSSRGRDALTGMLDPDAFEDVMAQEDARVQRYGHPATVIVFELDGLAKLVDRLGAEPGDRIEVALADTITRLARRADHVARLDRGRYDQLRGTDPARL